MLGEKIVENEQGKITGVRVLPPDGPLPRMEITFQSTGKILGQEFSNTGTIVSGPDQPEGGFIDTGQGVLMTQDGGIASWTYQGMSVPSGRGLESTHAGCVFFQTTSKQLERLNTMCVVVDGYIDADGNLRAELTEWKSAQQIAQRRAA